MGDSWALIQARPVLFIGLMVAICLLCSMLAGVVEVWIVLNRTQREAAERRPGGWRRKDEILAEIRQAPAVGDDEMEEAA